MAGEAEQLSMGILYLLRDEFTGPARKVGSAMGTLEAQAKQAADNTTGSLDKLTEGMALVGTAAAALASVGVPVAKAMELEKALARAGALSEATAADMELLRKSAMDLGASTVYTATQVAEAQQELAAAGFSAAENTAAMPGILAMASAGQVGLAEASAIGARSLRAFGLEASQSGHVADVLAATSVWAMASITGLGETMKYVGPVAKTLGVSLEDTAAMAALMSDAGIQGSQAGTYMRGGMLRLAQGTKKVRDGLHEFGVSIDFVKANISNMPAILAALEPGYRSMDEAQRAAALGLIFGQEAVSGWAAVLERGSAEVTKFSGKLKDAGGFAEKVAGRQLDNLAGDLEALSGATEGAAISLGTSLLPVLRPLVQQAAAFMARLQALIEANPELARSVMTVAGALAVVLTVWASHKAALWGMAEAIKVVGPALARMRIGFLQSGFAAGGVRGAMLSSVGPILQLVAAAYLLQKAWELDFGGIRTTLMAWWKDASMVFGGLEQLMKTAKGGVGSMSRETADKLGRAGLLGTTVTLFQHLQRASSMFKGFLDGLLAVGKLAVSAVGGILDLVGWIGKLVGVSDEASATTGKLAGTMDPARWEATGKAIGIVVGVVWAAQKAWWAWNAAVAAYGFLSTAVSGLKAWHTGMQITLKTVPTATAAQWAYNAALAACPYVLIAMAAIAWIAAMVALIAYYDEVTAWLGKWTAGWVDAGDVIILMLFGLIGPVGWLILVIRKVWQHWDQIKGIVGEVWDLIKTGAESLVGFQLGLWRSFFGFFIDAWDAVGGTVLAVLQRLLVALLNVVTIPIRNMLGLINAIPESVLPAMAVELRGKVNAFLEEGVGGVKLAAGPEGGTPTFQAATPKELGPGTAEAVTSRAVAGEGAAAAAGQRPVAVTVEAPKQPVVVKSDTVLQVDGREMARVVQEHTEGAQARGLAGA